MASLKNNSLPHIAFIVGMGRSGTTLLTNMFNSNPGMISTPENEFILFMNSSFASLDFAQKGITQNFNRVFDYDYNNVLSIWRPDAEGLKVDISELENKNYADVCKLVYLNYPFAGKSKNAISCIVDKNPTYSLYLDKIHPLYPDAKYIVLVRDFRDNVLSRKTKSEKTNSLNKMAVSWNFYYEKIYRDMERFKLNAHLVRYEDLVADPENVLKELCAFLKVDYSPQMLEFQGLSTKIKTHVKENASKEVYDKITNMHSNLEKKVNSDRVKAYEKELSKEEIAYLNYTCGYFGQKFGYLSEEEFQSIKPAAGWDFNNRKARIRLKFYYAVSRLYYSIPVSMRLMLLKKRS